jgi:hypothetical protein
VPLIGCSSWVRTRPSPTHETCLLSLCRLAVGIIRQRSCSCCTSAASHYDGSGPQGRYSEVPVAQQPRYGHIPCGYTMATAHHDIASSRGRRRRCHAPTAQQGCWSVLRAAPRGLLGRRGEEAPDPTSSPGPTSALLGRRGAWSDGVDATGSLRSECGTCGCGLSQVALLQFQ